MPEVRNMPSSDKFIHSSWFVKYHSKSQERVTVTADFNAKVGEK